MTRRTNDHVSYSLAGMSSDVFYDVAINSEPKRSHLEEPNIPSYYIANCETGMSKEAIESLPVNSTATSENATVALLAKVARIADDKKRTSLLHLLSDVTGKKSFASSADYDLAGGEFHSYEVMKFLKPLPLKILSLIAQLTFALTSLLPLPS